MTLISLRAINEENISAAVSLSLFRARFAQLMLEYSGLGPLEGDLFLRGLFSMLDDLLQRCTDQILEEVKALPVIKQMQVELEGPNYHICERGRAYEDGNWYPEELR